VGTPTPRGNDAALAARANVQGPHAVIQFVEPCEAAARTQVVIVIGGDCAIDSPVQAS